MRYVTIFALILVGCGGTSNPSDFLCQMDPQCNLRPGGLCLRAVSGMQSCAYPEGGCDSGYAFDNGACVQSDGTSVVDAEPPPPLDANVDGAPDAPLGTPDAPPPAPCRVSYGVGGGELWIADVSGDHAVRIAIGNPIYYARWSPKGDRILFVSKREASNTTDVYSVNPEGTVIKNLTQSFDIQTGALADENPVWSPDGQKFLWRRGTELWLGLADGSYGKAVTALAVESGDSYEWIADSAGFVFTHRNYNVGVALKRDLYFASTLGGPAQNITATPDVEETYPRLAHNAYRVAFVRATGADWDLWTVGINGADAVNLTPNTSTFTDGKAVWSADDKTLMFESDREGGRKLWSVPASGGQAKRLTNHTLTGGIMGDLVVDTSATGQLLFTRILDNRGDTSALGQVAGAGGTAEALFAATSWGMSYAPCTK